ncbi:hypothetical protein CONCODRAFT_12682 [Conidiobolus coronatus NRRL 28638]|uniref:Uncharacterized protein n=1 Tax=Conidiobolus coronatus (strain ATCC 28846 / CBS 209.66 / NRRL 28638) TaxID=796925 RepID=A0A137NSD3_CONC2|nr:hypothetical protein CONCODRAFT_12682 [Conidiobolus coronatus NRRL 28638]|eukprot:KXN65665.1 hypothetical protein CONCODRAFT_12682 [Conidiobolus coronatus NRRL 28638]
MKFPTQLVTIVITPTDQAQNSDAINFVNSQISSVDASLPTAQVQRAISFVDRQINQASAIGISTIIIGIDNNGGNTFAGSLGTQPTPTDSFNNNFATPIDGSSETSKSFGNSNSGSNVFNSASTSTSISSSNSGSQITSPVKYTYFVSSIAFTLIGNYLL